MMLESVLAPMEQETFLRDYVGQRYLLARGQPGRFSSLVSWRDLNETLSRLRVDDQRVRLIKRAKDIPRGDYIHTSKSGGSEYLNGPAVNANVLDGASLVVNQVDELFPEVRALAESCEDIFRVYVSANLYAGWRTDHGFDLHWDRHDTLIVQIIGRKSWKVWPPTREHPMSGDAPSLVPRPTSDPVWDGTLEDGDVLYMPRGWWHVASPLNEPSLHVTFAIQHPTGLNLLEWLATELREVPAVRLDAPHWKCTAEQAQWIESLRAAWSAALTPEAFANFMASRDVTAHSRPIVDLPHVTESATPTLDDELQLRLVRGRRLVVNRVDDTVAFDAEGTTWRCDASLAPALAILNHVRPCTVAEMASLLDDRGRVLLRPFITALLMSRVIWGHSHVRTPVPV